MKQILFISYTCLLLSITVFSFLFIDPNLSFLHIYYSGFSFTQREATTFLYIVFICLLFVLYLTALFAYKKKLLTKTDVIRLIATASFVLLFSYPAMLSYDIFNYISTARVAFHYHENPYIIMPIEFTNDPFFTFTRATNKVALYGPLWIILTSVPYVFGFGTFLIIFFNFKLLILLFFIATLFLIYKITQRLFPVILFGLHPLVLAEVVAGAHNDIVMMFFALLAVYLLTQKKLLLAVVVLLLSILIKYATIFLVPVFLYYLWRSMKGRPWSQQELFLFSGVAMFFVFLLTPIREEMYPWYATWFLTFLVLLQRNWYLVVGSLLFAFALQFGYVPYMYSGNYFGLTPLLRVLLISGIFAGLAFAAFSLRGKVQHLLQK